MEISKQHDQQQEAKLFSFAFARTPEYTYQKTFKDLTAQGVRRDVGKRLAAYAAFNNEEFNPHSDYYIKVHEDIGLEPEVNGVLAA